MVTALAPSTSTSAFPFHVGELAVDLKIFTRGT